MPCETLVRVGDLHDSAEITHVEKHSDVFVVRGNGYVSGMRSCSEGSASSLSPQHRSAPTSRLDLVQVPST